MKQIIISLFLIIFSFSLIAQEVQSDLIFNPAYRVNQHLKNQNNTFDLCNAGFYLNIQYLNVVNPECANNNGSIQLDITSSAESFDFYLNDSLIASGSLDTQFIFENLESGAYRIRIETSDGQEENLFYALSNEGVDEIADNTFVPEAAFCGEGGLQKTDVVETEVTFYEIYDEFGNLITLISQLNDYIPLPPGNYFVQKQGVASNCVSYYAFEIEQTVSNTLPFIDDFSDTEVFPSPDRWTDQQAFINRSFAIDPLSVGVATLDGLDENGFPYLVNDVFVAGSADSLTSQPFCISGISELDSLYFSFLFQPQGISDFPNDDDSLFVDFRGESGKWYNVWSIGGEEMMDGQVLRNDTFYQVSIPVLNDTMLFPNDVNFFYDGFQFRFRNIATITGLNDPWHLDYVQLDTVSNAASLIIQDDFTFVYAPPSILKNYSSMPWNQFYDYQDKEFVDSLRFTFRANNNILPQDGSNYRYRIYELCDSILIEANDSLFAIGGPTNQTNEYSLPLLGNTLPDLSENKEEDENIIVRTDYILETDNDFYKGNDTLQANQIFSNYYAYDDGTAEKVYGVFGQGAQIAVEFNLNQPDVLKGVQVYFTHIVGDVSSNTFSIKAWSSIDNDTDGDLSLDDVVIASRSDIQPIYTGDVCGFTTYIFDEPVPIDSTFYVGIEQDFVDILNIGHDVNNLVYDTTYVFSDGDTSTVDPMVDEYRHRYAGGKTFINANGVWLESILAGAVMIRPLVGVQNPWNTSVENIETPLPQMQIYPNPTSDLLHIALDQNIQNSQLQVYDFAGRLIQTYNGSVNSIMVRDFPAGMYLLRLVDERGKMLGTEKFVKH